MSELAIKLIEKEKQERKGKLDLGKCGLKAIPQKLFELIWLEELSLCNEIWDYNKIAWIHSTNLGSSNIINVEELPTEFKSLTRLKKLYYGGRFSENWKLKKCNILSSLGNLQTLYLSSNQISDISFLENLTGLQTLYLSFNQISDISFLENLTGLQSLYLSFNQISDISFLENLTSLQTLYLSSNQISDHSFLENLTGLQTLYLRSNKISDISFLENLTGLQTLYLSSNQISDISFLENLTSLQTLYLRYNQISDISFLENLTGLQTLYLRSNKISDISFLENLTGLQTLYLRDNQISDISFLENLTSLQTLDLRSNKISDISFLENLTGLQTLYLSSNQISDHSFLENLTGLQSLYLRDNQISDHSFLENLTGLQTLDLSYNQISDISFLENLTSLQTLYLSFNQISDYSFLENLTGLQTLDLRYNQISDIKPLLPLIKLGAPVSKEYSRTGILIGNNPISTPPMYIIEEGREAVISWFEQAEKQGGFDKLFEAKLIIVGEPGAGKTTLMKKLINPEYNLESKEAKELNSTVGINIYDGWTFPTKEDESISFSCNLWDFGGQEIQYMTHQFFLTPSALYVLVADDRKQHANFPYWFETIHLLGKEDNYQSPILVVLNENKHKSITNFDHHFYIKRYPHTQIQQNEVDLSKTGSRYYALREKVQQILCKLKHIGDEVPKQWKPIRDELKEIAKTQNHISEKDFFAICAKHKVAKEEDQLLISKYLHKLGSILHFQNDNYLRDFIILNPQWAVDAVYGVLENNTIAKNGGRFNKIQLDSIWKKYDRDEKFKLLNLMKKEAFEICYEVEEDEFIAAQLLGKIQPRYKWENEEALKFRYRYQFMPKGIITRFIVRCNKYIAYTESQKPLVWDKGIIIENSGCKALIIEDISNKEGLNVIDIEVIGEVNEKKFILRTIRKEIEAIHKKWFKNVKCEPMVPCICNDCKASETPTFFEYNELIKYRNQGEREIKCSNNRIKPVNVMELLEGIYLREELLREENMINEYHNKLSQHIDFKPTTSIKLTVDTEAKAGAKATAKAKATNTIAIEIQNILAETEMLKEDIEDERKLLQKEMDSDEIDVTVRDVEKAEKAMQEIEAAKKDNQEPATKSKNRLKRFIDDLSDEKSSIHKALKLLRKGRDYGVRLAETYNKIAENIGMPLAPPLALDVIKKL